MLTVNDTGPTSVTPVKPLSPTYVPKIVAVYVPAVAVLNVTTVVQLPATPVTHEGTLTVGAVNPVEATVLKTTLSMPLKPGKPFSAVAVTVEVGPADPLVVVQAGVPVQTLAVIATQAGFTELSNNVPGCTVAGFGAPAAPLESVTQTPPGTLVPVQPVW